MSLCCGRFRRRTGWRDYAWDTRSAIRSVITALGKVYVPFTATSVSQAAAIASLDAADQLLARTDAVVAERTRVTAALARRRLHGPAFAGQLRVAAAGRAHRRVRRRAANAGLVVRPYGADGVRVTIGAPDENDVFIEFAQSWSVDG